LTLAEVVVVLVILLVGLALVVPAIHRARENARENTLRNNLRQIAVGMHGYHDTHSRLPGGGMAIEKPATNADSKP
jgi:type II secretory pathway pseudopilin PulG